MHRRYVLMLSLLAGTSLLALGGFNGVVDPYRAYRLLDPGSFREVKLEAANRVGKAEMLRHGGFDLVLLGSSRTAVGIDPRNSSWGSERVANVGLAGPTVFEVEEAFRYAASLGGLRRAVLFADFIMFKDAVATEGDYGQSLFNRERSALDYHLDNLVSLRATRHSLRTIWGYLHGTARTVGGTGLISHVNLENLTPEERFDRVLRSSLVYNYQGVYSPASVARVESMVELARAKGIALSIVLLPVHALQLEAIHHLGLWDDFYQWKQDLLDLTERDRRLHPDQEPIRLWDFTGYTTYSTEPVPLDGDAAGMRWWIDSSHFTPALGDLVVESMAETEPGEALGGMLTPENIGSREAQQRRDRDAYVEMHPREMAFFERVANHVQEYLANHRRRFGRG